MRNVRRNVRRNVDHFERLADSFLIIIISNLPFKEAARTSALSRRWRNIWHATSNPEFLESFFVPNLLTRQDSAESSSSDIIEMKKSGRRDFVDFVTGWISSYKEPKVCKFKLSLSNPQEFQSDVEAWIQFAINKKVDDLEVDFSDPSWRKEDRPKDQKESFKLPSYVYEKGVLKSLKLSSCEFIFPDVKNFEAIREIALSWVEITSSALDVLISNCKALEILSLKKCRNLDTVDITQDGLRLRTLNIEDCSPVYGINIFSENYRSSTLKSFKYFGALSLFVLDDLQNVEEVELDFGLEYIYDMIGDSLSSMLYNFQTAKVLSVCSYFMQVISTGEQSFMDLSNVRHLKIKSEPKESEFEGIFFMFKSCSFIEKLTIQMGVGTILDSALNFQAVPSRSSYKYYWNNMSRLDLDCFKTIKVIEVAEFKGTTPELDILVYLLHKCHNLERMSICTSKTTCPLGGDTNLYVSKANSMAVVRRASLKAYITVE